MGNVEGAALERNAAGPAKRKRGPRQDVARNKAAILEATAALLDADPSTVSMPAVAERAGLHVATVYRYFPTLEALHRAFLISRVEPLQAYAEGLTLDGVDYFEAVLGKWLDVVEKYGPALVLLRSREGYLSRRARGDQHVAVLEAAWGSAVRELMRVEQIDESYFERAMAIRNALLNSREVYDLAQVTRRSPAGLVRELTLIYRGALRGLVEADS